MNLSTQIKNHRTNKGLSQEDLAEKLYVSRQTISNWETDKTYPDVQSLLMMSTLFDTTIDDLVKGDIEIMKETVDVDKMKKLSWVMIGGSLLAILLVAPSLKLWGYPGLILPFIIWAVAMTAAVMIERLKKRHNVKTYAEILAFMENRPLDPEEAARERKRHLLMKTFTVVGVAVVAGGIVYVSMMLLFG